MSKAEKFEISKKVRAELDAVVRKTAGCAVERRLKSCLNPKYHVYEFWGAADGNVVNLNIEKQTATLMDATSKTVRDWRRLQARELKRYEAKLAREQKVEAKAQPAVKAKPVKKRSTLKKQIEQAVKLIREGKVTSADVVAGGRGTPLKPKPADLVDVKPEPVEVA